MTEPTNEERADRIYDVMESYCWRVDGSSYHHNEEDFRDMLTDMMHFCDMEGFDFDRNLRIARNNYEAEKEEPCTSI